MSLMLPDPDDAYEDRYEDRDTHEDLETLQAWREEDDERAQCLTAAERNPSMLSLP